MDLLKLIILLVILIILVFSYIKYKKWWLLLIFIFVGIVMYSKIEVFQYFNLNKNGYTQVVFIPPYTIDRGPSGSAFNEYRTILSDELINKYFDKYEESLIDNADVRLCGEFNNNNIFINVDKNKVYAVPFDVNLHTRIYMTNKYGILLLWDFDEAYLLISECENK